MVPRFGEVARYPLRDPEWPVKLLLGGVSLLLASLVLPVILYTGYLVAILRRTLRDPSDTALPEWFEGFEKLLLDGLVGYLVELIVNVVLVLVGFPGILLLTLGLVLGLSGQGQPVFAATLLTWPGLLLILIWVGLLYAFSWLLFVLIAQYTASDDLNDLLRLGGVLAAFRANFPDFARAFGYYFLLNLLASAITLVLVCTIVGLILTPFVAFYLGVIQMRLIGLAFYGAREAMRPINVG